MKGTLNSHTGFSHYTFTYYKPVIFNLIQKNPLSDLNKYVIPNKVKETHFKTMHRYYPCNDFISKFKEWFLPLCCFCK